MIATVRRTLSAFNVSVPSFAETPAAELREQQMRQERLLGDLLIVFGSVALGLSAIGIYGMLGYLVVRRTRDIGVRMAIGASRPDVARLILMEAVMPVTAGVLAGLLVSIVAARSLRAVIFGVSAYDARLLLGAAAVIVTTALLAAAVPTHRATTIDPLRALRVD